MEKNKIVKRNSSIELLRIISMLLIITSHLSIHGANSLNMNFSLKKIVLNCLCLGNLGSVLFILIAGYFYENDVSYLKIIKISIITIFYSTFIYFFLVIIKFVDFSLIDFMNQLFSLINGNYWFITSYLILLIFQPYLKILINSISIDHLKKLVIILLVLWILVPFLFKIIVPSFEIYSNSFTDLFVYYVLGAYLRRYNKIGKKIKLNIYIVLFLIFMISSVIILNIMSIKFSVLSKYTIYFLNRNSILILFLSLFLMIHFTNIDFKNKYINYISSFTLSVYIIHDNLYMRNIIWNKIFRIQCILNSKYFFLYILLTVPLVYIGCMFIENIRRFMIKKLIFRKD